MDYLQKRWNWIWALVGADAGLYAVFLFVDLCTSRDYTGWMKLFTTVLAFLIALFSQDRMVKAGLLLTVLCDYLLLFTGYYETGLLLFMTVHGLYIYRLYVRRQRRGEVAMGLVPLPLLFCACLYAVTLILDLLFAGEEAARTARLESKMMAAGIFLFFLCDILTAYFYLSGDAVAGFLIWAIYAPSQLLIALSPLWGTDGRPLQKE